MSSNSYFINLHSNPFNSLRLLSLKSTQIYLIITILVAINSIEGRKHHLVLNNDVRRYFTVSTFGFFTGGSLSIEVKQFSADPFKDDAKFGLTLAKTMSDSLTPYLEGHEEHCLLLDDVKKSDNDNIGLVSMRFDLKNKQVVFNCNNMLSKLRFYDGLGVRPKRSPYINQTDDKEDKTSKLNKPDDLISDKKPETKVVNKKSDQSIDDAKDVGSPTKPFIDDQQKQSGSEDKPIDKNENKDVKQENEIKSDNGDSDKQAGNSVAVDEQENGDGTKTCSIKFAKLSSSGDPNKPEFSFKIQALIVDEQHEGLYSLFFHNCPNYHMGYGHASTKINLSMFITEQNLENYLSAGEIPLPQLYFALSVIFFLIGVVWIHVIRNKKNDAFKIHYLMAALVFVKAFALLFHGVNYHFIAKEGSQVETWAVIYYITHLLKGALLFITIVLIGTGWAFIKHILSDKDKKIFMIVIPLQVLANIADILTEESEEGSIKHNMWREIFILVDLLCCGAILFPVVWSIRHLQEASQTDGKAAINLRKLKLFRHFYVMIVCYIYFTRIIVYLLKITMPFQYEWLDVFFQHMATLLFFCLTGYHFQPTSTNPYFQLTEAEDEMDLEEVLFIQPDNGFSETKKRNRDRDIETDPDTERLITKRESSHDFD